MEASRKILLLSSSSFLEKDLKPILGKLLNEYRLAHIITSSKGKGVNSLDYLDRTRKRFSDKNVEFEDVDIDGMSEEQLETKLREFDGVFVNGGSTFYLLQSMRSCGFGEVIRKLLTEGYLYIGASAGSYVCCPTIEMALWKHQDKYDHCGLTDFTGLNLVPFLVTVHYSEKYREVMLDKIPKADYPTRILTDDQAIFVMGDMYTLLGGEEITLNNLEQAS